MEKLLTKLDKDVEKLESLYEKFHPKFANLKRKVL